MQIRESTDNEKDSIFRIHKEAFGKAEGQAVAKLTIDLLEDKTAHPILSLVAECERGIVGHILFTSVSVNGFSIDSAYILAPLAVATGHQGKGIGGTLISEGLRQLKERNASFVLVLGDPKYYGRAGFKAGHHITPPYKLEYPDAWMALELREGALKSVKGMVRCAASLSSPEHW